MARIKINDLQRAPDMAILILDHNVTGERTQRRVPAAVINKYRRHADGSRDFDLTNSWTEVPGLSAAWELFGWFEGVESVDTDTGWLERPGDFYEQTNDDAEDIFYVWVPGELRPREYPLAIYTVTRSRRGVTVTPDLPDGIRIDKGFLIY